MLCLLYLFIVINSINSRKIKLRQQNIETTTQKPSNLHYYAAVDPHEGEEERDQPNGGRAILVNIDDYNGLYGEQVQRSSQVSVKRLKENKIQDDSNVIYEEPKHLENTYLVNTRASQLPHHPKHRVKEVEKTPPVQTIRNYNTVNDDGSFTFGYEAADGSFKEETRGTDCVVRGKYGYIDPDGNKREFTYVSGNPCDPNAKDSESDEENKTEEDEQESDEEANYPKQFPVRAKQKPIPSRPILNSRPVGVKHLTPARPTVTVFENVYQAADNDQEDHEENEQEKQEPLQVLRPQKVQKPAVTYINHVTSPRPYLETQSTTSQVIYHSTPVNITPRPVTTKVKLPATTYRPQLVQVTAQPQTLYSKTAYTRPIQQLIPTTVTPKSFIDFNTEFQKFSQGNTIKPSYSRPIHQITPTTSPPSKSLIDFNAELQNFAQQNNVLISTPAPNLKAIDKNLAKGSNDPLYTSELVFDPSTGQYNTQLYQALPQTAGKFTLNQKLQPFIPQPISPALNHQKQLINLQLQQSPLYKTIAQPQSLNLNPASVKPVQFRQEGQVILRPQLNQLNQQLYQQNQAELQFQNSQQLFAQQQKARQQTNENVGLGSHRFGLDVYQRQQANQIQQPQQYYLIQPSANNNQQLSTGQIDAFLRSHNIHF